MIARLKEKLIELQYVKSALATLQWDQEVYMPKGGAKRRAEVVSYLTGFLHEKFTSQEFEEILLKAREDVEKKKLSPEDEAIIREVAREFDREKKLPAHFVKCLAEKTSEAHLIWVEAKKKSDFKIFAPSLREILSLKRQEAQYVGYETSPYDALIDTFEPSANSEELSKIFEDVKSFLIPFIQKIRSSKIKTDQSIFLGNFPIDLQNEFNHQVAMRLGFDFEKGRLDISEHPFTTHFHAEDVRITTRFKKDSILYSLGSTIHETGHALYEQGILHKHFGTPLGESSSFGIHESQSRLWENHVGRGKPFWKFFYPRLQKAFKNPFGNISFEDFYKNYNHVEPSLIRTEADEVTYNLHIILRFELEKLLIDGSIEVTDISEIWNEKMKEYLGVDVPLDQAGVLQDVHWSAGYFGYFPSYTLGNLLAAQLYEKAKVEIPLFEEGMAEGEFGLLREWLRRKIHIHGKFFTSQDLIQEATSEPLSSKYFTQYLQKKYSEIYSFVL